MNKECLIEQMKKGKPCGHGQTKHCQNALASLFGTQFQTESRS